MNRNNEDLGVYLKDHYAGGIGAIELLEHLAKTHEDVSLKEFFQALLADIRSDHQTLHRLMTELGIEGSSLRNAGAWMAEKLGRAKLAVGVGGNDNLADLQAIETLFIGITGKRLLWRALEKVRSDHPSLREIDLAGLENRALQQLDRVEARRLETAKTTFRP